MRLRGRRSAFGCLAAAIAVVLIGPVSPAGATYPGSNGDILYVREGAFRAMAPDGSGDHVFTSFAPNIGEVSFSARATKAAGVEFTSRGSRIVLLDLVKDTRSVVLPVNQAPTQTLSSVALSPRARRVAFTDGSFPRHLFTIRTDGSHLTKIANGYGDVDWGSNGRLVASNGIFASDGDRFIATMDPDGGNKTVIATFPPVNDSWRSVYELVPSWAPDCGSVVFAAQRRRITPDIWSVESDGSGLHRLTRTRGASESGPLFSPDGTKIVFSKEKSGSTDTDLWTMDADGGNKSQLTDTPAEYEFPVAWLPAS